MRNLKMFTIAAALTFLSCEDCSNYEELILKRIDEVEKLIELKFK